MLAFQSPDLCSHIPDESTYFERHYDFATKEYNKIELVNIQFPAIKNTISHVIVLLLSWERIVFLNLPAFSNSKASLSGRDHRVLSKTDPERKGRRVSTSF